MKIMFLIRSLDIGGAERQLIVLAKALHAMGMPCVVVTFYEEGGLVTELLSSGVRVTSLAKKGRWDILFFMWKLYQKIKREQPTILHSYLGSANMLAVLFKSVFPKMRVVWGVRASNMDLTRYDWLSRIIWRLECKLSSYPDSIIANSIAGRDYAVKHGFPLHKIHVVPNGIDTNKFKPNSQLRAQIRTEWSIFADAKLVGLIARLDPMKDHPTFLRAALLLKKQYPSLRFVCIGDGPPEYKAQLLLLVNQLELKDELIWTGSRSDMPAVYNALDIAVSSSYGEGFSNAVAEAMACGIPCVVTAAGDSPAIVGSDGVTVPTGSPKALANGIARLIDMPGSEFAKLKENVRNRIQDYYSIAALVSNTIKVIGVS
jgi:glycosyltransferase involved in cell wall biosynthesis